jgi:uncharacterized membrane protein
MKSKFNPFIELDLFGRVITYRPQSNLGCFLVFTLMGGVISLIIFLTIEVYLIIFSLFTTRLGISYGAGVLIWVSTVLLSRVNIPLYPPLSINIGGGLIPTLIALYQFNRIEESSAIFAVAGIVTILSYFSAMAIPGKGICIWTSYLLLIALVAAICSNYLVTADINRCSVTFTGCVLGTLVGGDLLHLKDMQIKREGLRLSIGAAGTDDWIVYSGCAGLIFTEWLP